MILPAERIASLLREGENPTTTNPLVITPKPNLDDLARSGAASVDLRLGTWFVVLRAARLTHLNVQEEAGGPLLTKTHYVPFGDEYYLHPRSFVLGVTLEWIHLPQNIAGYVIGKSSWGRRGLIIATAAGVHPGFAGCLTLELTNVGEIPIAIRPGMSICQLFLHHVESKTTDHVDQSRFVGFRRPTLGAIKADTIADKLGTAYGAIRRGPARETGA